MAVIQQFKDRNTDHLMPRIPTIDSQVTPGITPSPTVSPGLFDVSPGLRAVAGGLERQFEAGVTATAVMEKRRRDAEDSWVIDNMIQYDRVMSDFMNNPDNYARIDLADAIGKFHGSEQSKYVAAAPSNRAAKDFRQRTEDAFNRYRDRALKVGEANRIGKMDLALKEMGVNILAGWRNNINAMPIGEAGDLLEQNYDSVMEHIDRIYAGMPEKSQSEKEKLTRNIVLGAAEFSPTLAAELLDKYSVFDESDRQTIMRQIESIKDRSNAHDSTVFNIMAENAETNARLHGTPMPEMIAPSESAQLRYDERRKEVNAGVSAYHTLKSWNADNQNRVLANMMRDATDPAVMRGLDWARKALDDNQSLQDTDPVQWLTANNTELRDLMQKAETATGEDKLALEQTIMRTVMDLQGHPGPDVPEYMRPHYLRKAFSEINLMDKRTANDWGMKFAGDPAQFQAVLNQFITQYSAGATGAEAEKYVRTAFNDLWQLPDAANRVPAEYMIAFMMHDSPYVSHYMAALKGRKDISGVTKDTYKDYEAAVVANPNWRSFRQYMFDGGAEAMEDLNAMDSGLAVFAQTLDPANMTRGANAAVKILFENRYGFINVNGKRMMIDLRLPSGRQLVDSDTELMEEGLTALIQSTGMDQVQLEDPMWGHVFAGASIEDKAMREGLFKSAMAQHGYLRTLPDGSGAEFWMVGDYGIGFDVKGKDGKTLTVKFDDYTSRIERPKPTPSGAFGGPITEQPKEKRTYRWLQ